MVKKQVKMAIDSNLEVDYEGLYICVEENWRIMSLCMGLAVHGPGKEGAGLWGKSRVTGS